MTKKKKVKMSVPKGMEFDKEYNMDHTLHNEFYWETDRNLPPSNSNIDVIVECEGVEIKNDFKTDLLITTKELTDLLISKNKAYGNTALNPVKVFSRLNSSEALCARIDDKIMRIKNKGINDETEDTVSDLIGYLLLLKMSMKK